MTNSRRDALGLLAGAVGSLAGEPAGASRLGETLDRPTSFAELFEFVDAGFPQNRMSGASMGTGTTILGAYGFWNSVADDRRNVRWVDNVLTAAAPLSTGYVVGEANVRAPKHASRCFSSDAWRKLAALKQRFDPRDVFFSLS